MVFVVIAQRECLDIFDDPLDARWLMKIDWQKNKSFWRDAVISAGTIAILAAFQWAAAVIHKLPEGRFPSMIVEVMRSRAIIENPGVAGYYERLLGAGGNPMFMDRKKYETWSKGFRDRIYDRSFRLVRFRPNLDRLVDGSEPQGVTTNSFGLLGPERSLRKLPNRRRVALFGDSVAQGWGTDQSRSWASLFENRLNSIRPGGTLQQFEVLNFAFPGYSLTQMLDVAEDDAPKFEPDVYMLALTELPVFRIWNEHLICLVRLGIDLKYDFLREIVRQAGAESGDDPNVLLGKLAPYRIPVIRGALAKMKLCAERDHVPFIVILVPSLEEGGLSRKRFDGIHELLASLDIPAIDLLDTFDGVQDQERLRINPADVHPNAVGHTMIFENLYAKLQRRPELWATLIGKGAARATQAAKASSTDTSF
jgi:lysophospholipase L1-like esterase